MKPSVFAICAAGLLTISCIATSCDSGGPADRDLPTATFWYSYGGRNRDVLEELIDRFHAVQDDYRIEATFQGGYFETLAKLRLAIVTGEQPTFSHVVGEVLPYLWGADVLADLTPFAEGERSLDQADLIPALTQDGYFDYAGLDVPLFALPFNRSTPILFYNRDIFARAGVQPPDTWDDLRRVAELLTVRENDRTVQWGFEVPIDWWFWIALLYQADGSLMNEDNSDVTFDGRAGGEALELWVEMVREDRTQKPPPGRDFNAWGQTNVDFLAGNVAMIWTSTAFLSYLTDTADFEVGAAFLPGHRQRGVPTGGTFFVMLDGGDSKAQEAAWAFMHFMMQPEQTAYWSRRTGYMPVHRRALELPEMVELYAENPNYRVALDQLEHAVPFPFSPALYTIQRQHVQPRLELPVLGLEAIEDALNEAAEAARHTLEVYPSFQVGP